MSFGLGRSRHHQARLATNSVLCNRQAKAAPASSSWPLWRMALLKASRPPRKPSSRVLMRSATVRDMTSASWSKRCVSTFSPEAYMPDLTRKFRVRSGCLPQDRLNKPLPPWPGSSVAQVKQACQHLRSAQSITRVLDLRYLSLSEMSMRICSSISPTILAVRSITRRAAAQKRSQTARLGTRADCLKLRRSLPASSCKLRSVVPEPEARSPEALLLCRASTAAVETAATRYAGCPASHFRSLTRGQALQEASCETARCCEIEVA